MAWTVETLGPIVDRELGGLPVDQRAKFVRIAELIETHGLEKVREPYVRHLEGPLWEIRLKGRDGISRALYVTAKGERVVVVRVFVKKTQKTPRREIKLARERAREVKMTKLSSLRRNWMKDPRFRAEYEALEDEFLLAKALIEARADADLTQEEVARRMETSQSYVAKMESGAVNPSVKTLKRFADATGTNLRIAFEQKKKAAGAS